MLLLCKKLLLLLLLLYLDPETLMLKNLLVSEKLLQNFPATRQADPRKAGWESKAAQ